MTCPHCNGTKQNFVHVSYSDGTGGWKWVECHTCNGVGEITAEHMERIAEGKRMREDRRARHMSLQAEAERLGITVVELSHRELGRMP